MAVHDPERRGHAEGHEERQRQAVRAAQHAAALAAEGSAHVRQGARLGGRQYGDEKRANQVAWAAVKHSFQKVGDHWEKKAGGKKGPSDAQAAGGRNTNRKTAGGVDANANKAHLLTLAKKLDVSGRSR